MLHVSLFVCTFALGILLALLSHPAFSFVLYEAVYFFSPLERWWASYLPDLRYSYLTVVLMLTALVIGKLRGRQGNSLLAVPQFRWLYILLAFYGIAAFYAVMPEQHMTALTYYFKSVLVITIAYKLIDSRKSLDYALWGYVFGSWYLSFLVFQTGRNSFDRVEGVGTVDSPDANGIAAAIAPSLVICVYYFWAKSSKFHKLLFAFAGVFIANALILINSRGSFLGVGISLSFFMFYLYFTTFQRKYQKTMVVGMAIAGLAGLLYLADDAFFSRIGTMQNTEITLERQTATSRIVFWGAAIELANDRPFGSGFQGFDYYAPEYLPYDMDTGSTRNRSVHSSWFEVLTEAGYQGLLVFSLMIFASFRTLRTCMRKLRKDGDLDGYYKVIMLQAALLCFVVTATFINRFRAEILHWLVLYSACAYSIYMAKATEKLDAKSANG